MVDQVLVAECDADDFTWVLSSFIERSGLGDQLVAGGWDLVPETVENIEKGYLAFSIGSNAYMTGY